MALYDDATLTWRLREGVVAGVIDEHFTIMEGRPNGGYMLALCAAAGRTELAALGAGTLDPVASTGIFLAPPGVGEVEFDVDVLRVGRTAAHVQVTLRRGDQRCVVATFIYGTLTSNPLRHATVRPIDLPDPVDCIDMGGRETSPRMMDAVEILADPATMGWALGNPGGVDEQRGWCGFRDGRDHDALSLIMVLDAMPPATFGLGSIGWVPTLSMTAYLLAKPAPGPVRLRQRAELASDDAVDEVCDVVDAAGQVVAQATQLARVRFS